MNNASKDLNNSFGPLRRNHERHVSYAQKVSQQMHAAKNIKRAIVPFHDTNTKIESKKLLATTPSNFKRGSLPP